MSYLTKLADSYGTDKGTSAGDRHGFTDFYHEHLKEIRETAEKVFEIGIQGGQSIHMWLEYFPTANIFGMDNRLFGSIKNDRYFSFSGDQSNRESLNNFILKYGINFDMIIDDGGHHMNQQQISFGFLFPYVKEKGFYIIEDLHTSIFSSSAKFGAKEDNKTLHLLEDLKEKGSFKSPFLTKEEIKYIEDNVSRVEIYYSSDKSSITSVIYKK